MFSFAPIDGAAFARKIVWRTLLYVALALLYLPLLSAAGWLLQLRDPIMLLPLYMLSGHVLALCAISIVPPLVGRARHLGIPPILVLSLPFAVLIGSSDFMDLGMSIFAHIVAGERFLTIGPRARAFNAIALAAFLTLVLLSRSALEKPAIRRAGLGIAIAVAALTLSALSYRIVGIALTLWTFPLPVLGALAILAWVAIKLFLTGADVRWKRLFVGLALVLLALASTSMPAYSPPRFSAMAWGLAAAITYFALRLWPDAEIRASVPPGRSKVASSAGLLGVALLIATAAALAALSVPQLPAEARQALSAFTTTSGGAGAAVLALLVTMLALIPTQAAPPQARPSP